MKKILLVSLIVISVMFAEVAYSKKTRIIASDNAYGGTTKEVTYSQGEKEYVKGIVSTIEYYDQNSIIRQIDSYFRENYAADSGVFLTKHFYNHEPMKKPLLKKSEFYYTSQYSDAQGLHKSEQLYDDDGFKIRAEFYFTESWGKKKNYVKIEDYYDNNGEIYRRVYYDMAGNLVSSEEKQTD